MRDPERLTSSKGLSDLERELLDAGKNETMPAALREQMERALGMTGAAAAGGPVRARVEAATGVKASAIVWISAGVVVLAVVGGLVGVRLGSRLFSAREVVPVAAPAAPQQPVTVAAPSGGAARVVAVAAPAPAGSDVAPGLGVSPSTAPAPARRAVALAAAPVRLHSRAHAAASHAGTARVAGARRNHALSSSSSSRPAAPVESAAAAADTPSDPPAAEAPARAVATSEPKPSAKKVPSARSVAPSGDLRAEIDLIDGARGALRAGDTAEALGLLGQHAMHFPHGALAPEETALRVEALMRMGRTAEAKAYARRFVAANPASPLAERVRRLVNGDTAP